MARQILLLQVGVVWCSSSPRSRWRRTTPAGTSATQATDRALAVARGGRRLPRRRARPCGTADPSPTLQPYAEQVRTRHRRRLRRGDGPRPHPLHPPGPGQIGKPFVGDLGGAPDGEPFTQQYTGTLGPSMRAVVPGARRRRGRRAGLGRHHHQRDRPPAPRRPGADPACRRWPCWPSACSAPGWSAAGSGGRRTGSGEAEITRMYEYYSAVLHAVREGLLLLDDDGRVQLVNDEARRLLDLPDDVVGRRLDDLGLAPGAGRGRAWAAGLRPTTSTSPATACWSSARPRPRWDGRDGRRGGDPARPHRAAVGHR